MKQKQWLNNALLILIFLTISVLASGQLRSRKSLTSEVVITSSDTVVVTHIFIGKKTKLHDFKKYYWYYNNCVNVNRGMYYKNPLHGSYLVLSKDRKLITAGTFRLGLRVGVWKQWYHSGELQKQWHYYRGEESGRCNYFDSSGKLVLSEKYKHGLKHGKIKQYVGDSIIIIRYANGHIIAKSPDAGTKKSFFHFRNKKDVHASTEASIGNEINKPELSRKEKKIHFWNRKPKTAVPPVGNTANPMENEPQPVNIPQY